MALTLRQWRLAREITQNSMADALSVSVPTYQRWEANPDLMPLGAAKCAVEVLGLEFNDISFFADEATENCVEVK